MALPSQPLGAKFPTISASSSSSSLIPLKHLRLHRAGPGTRYCCRTLRYQVLRTRPSSALAVASSHSPDLSSAIDAPQFTSTVGSPPVPQWTLGPRHVLLLNFTACAVAILSAWLFLSAIPTLIEFRKTLESVEKLLEVAAEELPDTMASVRLSGLEISDLTRELSDLGEEITDGVRSSIQPLRVVGDRFQQLTTMNPKVMLQGQNSPVEDTKRPAPPVARAARELREGISKSRETFGMVKSVVGFSRWVFRGGKTKEK